MTVDVSIYHYYPMILGTNVHNRSLSKVKYYFNPSRPLYDHEEKQKFLPCIGKTIF